MRDVLEFVQSLPTQEAQEVWSRIRSNEYEDLTTFLRQIRSENMPTATSSDRPLPHRPNMMDQPRLPPLRSVVTVPAPLGQHGIQGIITQPSASTTESEQPSSAGSSEEGRSAG